MAIVESSRSGAVGVIKLNRPDVRNALSLALIADLAAALEGFEAASDVKVILLTGTPVFCAGADISEMRHISLLEALTKDFSGCCDRLARCSKPVIAAVEGYAIGGGCELIEMCDIVIAAADSRFGHPEIKLGTLSGARGQWTSS
jgi:enoyl-CoA hydratase